MKRKLPVLIAIAIALIIMLAACQPHDLPAAGVPLTQPPIFAAEPTTPPQTQPAETAPLETQPPTVAPTEPKKEADKQLTKEEAISKALSHAGLTKSQVSRLKAELDRDDGVTLYEIEFETAEHEYDYEVHATSGKILKSEKERHD